MNVCERGMKYQGLYNIHCLHGYKNVGLHLEFLSPVMVVSGNYTQTL